MFSMPAVKHTYAKSASILPSIHSSVFCMSTIGERIKALRKEVHMSQQDVADGVKRRTGEGLSRPAVAQWEGESTKGLRPENLIAVADLFMVNVRWLVTGTGPRLAADVKALSDIEARLVFMWRELAEKDQQDTLNYIAGKWSALKLHTTIQDDI